MTKRFYSVALLMLAISACSTLNVPMLRHETGESLGQGVIRAKAIVDTGRVFPLVPAAYSSANVTQASSAWRGFLFGLTGAYGVMESLDLQLSTYFSAGGGGWRIGGKWQVYGESFASGGAGNLAVSVASGIGRHSATGSTIVQSTVPTEGEVDQTLTASTWDVSFPVSYRISDVVAFYSGFHYKLSVVEGTANQAFVEDNFSDIFLNLGLRLNFGKFEADLEYGFASVDDPFLDESRLIPFFGVSFGMVF